MLTRRAVRRALCALPLTLVATATALPARAAVVDDTPAVSWQVNGPVYATAVVGDTVYVGGRFTEIVSSTGDTKPRGPATWQMLTDALATLAIASHPHAELFVFYSGHGDVAHGEGYVMLEDRRLTRRMLYQLLASSGAERNHVIVDACKPFTRRDDFPIVARSSPALDERIKAKWARDLPKGF